MNIDGFLPISATDSGMDDGLFVHSRSQHYERCIWFLIVVNAGMCESARCQCVWYGDGEQISNSVD